METITTRNLHRYARPAEATSFYRTCRVETQAAADRAEADRILTRVFGEKRAQHGELSTFDGHKVD